jgi:hypothetical protein
VQDKLKFRRKRIVERLEAKRQEQGGQRKRKGAWMSK